MLVYPNSARKKRTSPKESPPFELISLLNRINNRYLTLCWLWGRTARSGKSDTSCSCCKSDYFNEFHCIVLVRLVFDLAVGLRSPLKKWPRSLESYMHPQQDPKKAIAAVATAKRIVFR